MNGLLTIYPFLTFVLVMNLNPSHRLDIIIISGGLVGLAATGYQCQHNVIVK